MARWLKGIAHLSAFDDLADDDDIFVFLCEEAACCPSHDS